MPHLHEYRALFKCQNCHWDNDQTIEEDDAAPQKEVTIDCWHCGCGNDVVVKLEEEKS